MRRLFSSLYGRISLVFLALLIGMGAVQVVLSVRSALEYVRESDQTLNYGLAGDLAVAFEPFLADSLDHHGIEHLIHELMVMNPRVEIYILDAGGELLAYFADPESIHRMAVDVGPIREFLHETASGKMPIYGDDPRSADGQKPFSAAPISIAGERPGYVYVILGGQQYDTAGEMIRGSYIIRTSATALLVTVACTAGVGLLLFALVTRRVGRLTAVMERFQGGDLEQRASVDSGDEIGRLGGAFNSMADTIVRNLDELRETDRLRRELIANVSHDLRSPLASIQGYLETILMKEATLPQVERRRYLETIFSNTRSLGKLVEQLFELSKLDAKHVSPKPEPFSIAELAQDVALMLRPNAEQRGVEVATELPPDLPLVRGDIAMIERALTNLIENAVRYTPPHGRASIRLERHDGSLRVVVSDTGSGIAPDDLPHIFDRFYCARPQRSRKGGGTGLGLAIADKIVRAHGGEIQVESQLGVGTTFSFELPVEASSAMPVSV